MSRSLLLRWIQEPVGVAVAELYEAPMLKNGGLVYPLPVHVSVGIGVAWCQRCDTVGVRYHTMSGLYVRSVEL